VNNYILDSFAVLAWFQNEKGAGKVNGFIKQAQLKSAKLLMSVVNLGEVYYITYRERGMVLAEHTLSIIENLPIEIITVNKDLALKAAGIKSIYAVAYADAFSAALGIITESAVITGDPEFKLLVNLVKIEWLER
jgi:ribonuclease VapC